MIKFLPEKNQKEIKIEYFSRVLLFLLVFIFFAGVLAVVSIFPSYIIAFYRDISISAQSKIVQLNKIDTSEQENLIKNTNEIISFLAGLNNYQSSDDILSIIQKKNENITINQISFSREENRKKFIINGISKTREGLLIFVRDLKLDADFKGVNLPVSDFVKSSNIDFSLTLYIE